MPRPRNNWEEEKVCHEYILKCFKCKTVNECILIIQVSLHDNNKP